MPLCDINDPFSWSVLDKHPCELDDVLFEVCHRPLFHYSLCMAAILGLHLLCQLLLLEWHVRRLVILGVKDLNPFLIFDIGS